MAICVPRKVSTIALLGGGRWARVHAGILKTSWPALRKLVLVSHHNKRAMELWAQNNRTIDIEILGARDQLDVHRSDAAIVCTASAAHAEDAFWFLQKDIPTLVEKPLALHLGAAQDLVREAECRQQLLCVSLPFAMAGYLHEFKTECGDRRIAQARIAWFDPEAETRHGESKTTDFSTHRVDEVVPHVWSILDLLLGEQSATINSVLHEAPDTAVVRAMWGEAEVEISFGRHSSARRRRLDVTFDDGKCLGLDFSEEQALGIIDGDSARTLSWNRRLSPLEAVQWSFLSAIEQGNPTVADSIRAGRCLESVRVAELLRSAIILLDTSRLIEIVDNSSDAAEARILLLENIGPESMDVGRRLSRASPSARESFSDAILKVLRRSGTTSGLAASEPDAEIKRLFQTSRFLQQAVALQAKMP
jgi:predicted dehydrogenase